MSTVDIVGFVFILGLKIISLHGKPTFFGKGPQPLMCSGLGCKCKNHNNHLNYLHSLQVWSWVGQSYITAPVEGALW
jgi:hypothetical protein